MLKRSAFAVAVALFTSTLFAAGIDPAAEKFLRRSMMICPSSNMSLQAVTGGPPAFDMYKVTQVSSEQNCGRNGTALVSRKGNDLYFGDLIPIPPTKSIPLQQRMNSLATRLLKKSATAVIGTAVGTDGMRPVTITTQSKYGAFDYHGWVDPAGLFFFVGRRSDRRQDAGEALLSAIDVNSGASRGNTMGRIRVVELSDFQCPTCQRAHQALEPFFRQNLSKISYTRLDLSLFEHHDWSFEAAMAARAIQKVAPTKYWEYADFIFSNQDVIQAANVEKMIRDFMSDHDIDWKKIEPLYRSPTGRKAFMHQISHAFDAGILATPTFIVNGQMVYYGEDGAHLRAYLNSLVNAR